MPVLVGEPFAFVFYESNLHCEVGSDCFSLPLPEQTDRQTHACASALVPVRQSKQGLPSLLTVCRVRETKLV